MVHLSTRASRVALGAVIAVSVVLAGSRCSTDTARDEAASSGAVVKSGMPFKTSGTSSEDAQEVPMLDDGLLDDEPVGGEVEFDGATSDGSEQF